MVENARVLSNLELIHICYTFLLPNGSDVTNAIIIYVRLSTSFPFFFEHKFIYGYFCQNVRYYQVR